MDALPFEQEDQQPLIDVLSSHQDYGATGSTPTVNDESPEPPRPAAHTDDAESNSSMQSQIHRSQPGSRDGYTSLPVHGKKKSRAKTMDSTL